jgi:hypothetical protein
LLTYATQLPLRWWHGPLVSPVQEGQTHAADPAAHVVEPAVNALHALLRDSDWHGPDVPSAHRRHVGGASVASATATIVVSASRSSMLLLLLLLLLPRAIAAMLCSIAGVMIWCGIQHKMPMTSPVPRDRFPIARTAGRHATDAERGRDNGTHAQGHHAHRIPETAPRCSEEQQQGKAMCGQRTVLGVLQG